MVVPVSTSSDQKVRGWKRSGITTQLPDSIIPMNEKMPAFMWNSGSGL
jgi:hypothetical protein